MGTYLRLLAYPAVATALFYALMHSKGYPVWAWPLMFVILVGFSALWNRILPDGEEGSQRSALMWAGFAAVILLVLALVAVMV